MALAKDNIASGGQALTDTFYLERFVMAHQAQLDDALAELEAGQKETHWMWFIFPIAPGLAKSDIGQYYEISGLDEACAFLAHPELGDNFRRCVAVMVAHSGKSVLDILGKKDKWKFQASVTLFHHVTNDPALKADLKACLDNFYDGRPCISTSKYLASITA